MAIGARRESPTNGVEIDGAPGVDTGRGVVVGDPAVRVPVTPGVVEPGGTLVGVPKTRRTRIWTAAPRSAALSAWGSWAKTTSGSTPVKGSSLTETRNPSRSSVRRAISATIPTTLGTLTWSRPRLTRIEIVCDASTSPLRGCWSNTTPVDAMVLNSSTTSTLRPSFTNSSRATVPVLPIMFGTVTRGAPRLTVSATGLPRSIAAPATGSCAATMPAATSLFQSSVWTMVRPRATNLSWARATVSPVTTGTRTVAGDGVARAMTGN